MAVHAGGGSSCVHWEHCWVHPLHPLHTYTQRDPPETCIAVQLLHHAATGLANQKPHHSNQLVFYNTPLLSLSTVCDYVDETKGKPHTTARFEAQPHIAPQQPTRATQCVLSVSQPQIEVSRPTYNNPLGGHHSDSLLLKSLTISHTRSHTPLQAMPTLTGTLTPH